MSRRRGPRTRRPLRPEEIVDRDLRTLWNLIGAEPYKLSQGFRGHWDATSSKWIPDRGGTRQTPGLSDWEVWVPSRGLMFKWESKTPDGLKLHDRMIATPPAQVPKSRVNDWKRAHAQQRYADLCEKCGIPYGRGGVAEAVVFLKALGLYGG